jgi:hypothetical protein
MIRHHSAEPLGSDGIPRPSAVGVYGVEVKRTLPSGDPKVGQADVPKVPKARIGRRSRPPPAT